MPDGTQWLGEWVDDQMDGPATLVLPEGKEIDGIFKGNEFIIKKEG